MLTYADEHASAATRASQTCPSEDATQTCFTRFSQTCFTVVTLNHIEIEDDDERGSLEMVEVKRKHW